MLFKRFLCIYNLMVLMSGHIISKSNDVRLNDDYDGLSDVAYPRERRLRHNLQANGRRDMSGYNMEIPSDDTVKDLAPPPKKQKKKKQGFWHNLLNKLKHQKRNKTMASNQPKFYTLPIQNAFKNFDNDKFALKSKRKNDIVLSDWGNKKKRNLVDKVDAVTSSYTNLTLILSKLSTELDNLKKIYDIPSDTTLLSTLEPKIESTTEFMEPSEDIKELAFGGTAPLEAFLDGIKSKSMEALKSNPEVTEIVSSAVTETTFITDPILTQLGINNPAYEAVSALLPMAYATTPASVTFHPIESRSIKNDAIKMFYDLEEALQAKLKELGCKVKKISCKMEQKATAKMKEVIGKQKTTITAPKKLMTTSKVGTPKPKLQKQVQKNRTNRLSSEKHRQKTKMPSMTTVDDFVMLTLYEEMLAKTHEFNLRNMLSSTEPILASNADFNVAKREADDNEYGSTLPDYDSSPTTAEEQTEKSTAINYSNDQPTSLNYEALSKKISYDQFVDGYKYYLKYLQDEQEPKFSNLVKYQAHRHHNVDDIGKFILEKIPQINVRRTKRFFDDSDTTEELDVSTKSEDSWFKKHFYLFIDNSPGKKFHTYETIGMKPASTIQMDKSGSETEALSDESTSLDNVSSHNVPKRVSMQVTEPMSKSTTSTPMSYFNKVFRHIARKSDDPRINVEEFVKKEPGATERQPNKRSKRDESIETTAPTLATVEQVQVTANNFTNANITENPQKFTFLNMDIATATDSPVTESIKKENKIKKFFKRLYKKKVKNKKVKRQNQMRYQRFNPLKKIKNMLYKAHNKTESNVDFSLLNPQFKYNPMKWHDLNQIMKQIPNITAAGDAASKLDQKGQDFLVPWEDYKKTAPSKPAAEKDTTESSQYTLLNTYLAASNVEVKDEQNDVTNDYDDSEAEFATEQFFEDARRLEGTSDGSPQILSDEMMRRVLSKILRQDADEDILNIINDSDKLTQGTESSELQKSVDTNSKAQQEKNKLIKEAEVIDKDDTANPSNEKEQNVVKDNDSSAKDKDADDDRSHTKYGNYAFDSIRREIDKIQNNIAQLNVTNLPKAAYQNVKIIDPKPKVDVSKRSDITKIKIPVNGLLYSLDPRTQARTPVYENLHDASTVTKPLVGVRVMPFYNRESEANAATVSSKERFTAAPDNAAEHRKSSKKLKDYFYDLMIWNGDVLSSGLNPSMSKIMKALAPETSTLNTANIAQELNDMSDFIDYKANVNEKHDKKSSQVNKKIFMLSTSDKAEDTAEDKGRNKRHILRMMSAKDIARILGDDTVEKITSRNVAKLKGENQALNKTTRLWADTTLFAYDDELDYLAGIVGQSKLTKNSLPNDKIKNKGYMRPSIHPTQYFSTPLPMAEEDFLKFLKENELDISSVTAVDIALPTILNNNASKVNSTTTTTVKRGLTKKLKTKTKFYDKIDKNIMDINGYFNDNIGIDTQIDSSEIEKVLKDFQAAIQNGTTTKSYESKPTFEFDKTLPPETMAERDFDKFLEDNRIDVESVTANFDFTTDDFMYKMIDEVRLSTDFRPDKADLHVTLPFKELFGDNEVTESNLTPLTAKYDNSFDDFKTNNDAHPKKCVTNKEKRKFFALSPPSAVKENLSKLLTNEEEKQYEITFINLDADDMKMKDDLNHFVTFQRMTPSSLATNSKLLATEDMKDSDATTTMVIKSDFVKSLANPTVEVIDHTIEDHPGLNNNGFDFKQFLNKYIISNKVSTSTESASTFVDLGFIGDHFESTTPKKTEQKYKASAESDAALKQNDLIRKLAMERDVLPARMQFSSHIYKYDIMYNPPNGKSQLHSNQASDNANDKEPFNTNRKDVFKYGHPSYNSETPKRTREGCKTKREVNYTDTADANPKINFKRQSPKNFQANNVAGFEIVVDFVKNLEKHNVVPTYTTEMATAAIENPVNNLQILIAIPEQGSRKRSVKDDGGVKKIFAATLSAPVDMKYQVISFTEDGDGSGRSANPPPPMIAPQPKIGYYLYNLSNDSKADIFTKPATTQASISNNKNIGKVTLSKDFIAAVNRHLVQLYESFSNITKPTGQSFDLFDSSNRSKRKLNWKTVTKWLNDDRVCTCKCMANKTMCRACAASDRVISELIFEFDNLNQYIKDHCTEIQTYFWMNPRGGRKLKEAVHRLDMSMTDYLRRCKGKCQGRTCETIGKSYLRRFDDSPMNALAQDLENASRLVRLLNQNLTYKYWNFVDKFDECVAENSVVKTRQISTPSYSIDNINVHIICKSDRNEVTDKFKIIEPMKLKRDSKVDDKDIISDSGGSFWKDYLKGDKKRRNKSKRKKEKTNDNMSTVRTVINVTENLENEIGTITYNIQELLKALGVVTDGVYGTSTKDMVDELTEISILDINPNDASTKLKVIEYLPVTTASYVKQNTKEANKNIENTTLTNKYHTTTVSKTKHTGGLLDKLKSATLHIFNITATPATDDNPTKTTKIKTTTTTTEKQTETTPQSNLIEKTTNYQEALDILAQDAEVKTIVPRNDVINKNGIAKRNNADDNDGDISRHVISSPTTTSTNPTIIIIKDYGNLYSHANDYYDKLEKEEVRELLKDLLIFERNKIKRDWKKYIERCMSTTKASRASTAKTTRHYSQSTTAANTLTTKLSAQQNTTTKQPTTTALFTTKSTTTTARPSLLNMLANKIARKRKKGKKPIEKTPKKISYHIEEQDL